MNGDDTALDAALWRHLDGRADAADAALLSQRLSGDPSFAARVAMISRLEAELAEERPRRRVMQPKRRLVRRRWLPAASRWSLAAALLVACTLVLWPHATAKPGLASVFGAGAGAEVVDAQGQRQPLHTGAGLAAGDQVQAGTTPLELALTDGSRLTLEAHTGLILPTAQTSWRLLDGALQVVARPQPADNPLSIRSAEAQVTVVGTRFRFASSAGKTNVHVTEGAVRLSSGADSELVPAGCEAWVTAGWPISGGTLLPQGREWQSFTFEDETPPLGWRSSTVVRASARNGRCLEATSPHYPGFNIISVRWQDWTEGVCDYDPGLVLVASLWRSSAASDPNIWLGHLTDGSGLGFTVQGLPHGRWWRIAVPLADFSAALASPPARASRPGERIAEIAFQSSAGTDARLLVDDVQLIRRETAIDTSVSRGENAVQKAPTH